MKNERQWMAVPSAECPFCAFYRNRFTTQQNEILKFEYSGDEHVAFYLDGKNIVNGPEKGCPERWYLGHVSVPVEAGEHTLTAHLCCFGKEWTAVAQMSIQHGLYVSEESSLLTEWECTLEKDVAYELPFPDWGAYPRVRVGTKYNSALLCGDGDGWQKVKYYTDTRILHEPDLPPMRCQEIFPDSVNDTIIKFDKYVCVWSHYIFRGQGKVRIRWAETPYLTEKYDNLYLKGEKGNRTGSFFVGNFDEFKVNGTLEWHDCWWRAGHYVQIITEGSVTVESHFMETGYPLPQIKTDSPLEAAAFATLQACSHETFMDCPFYEQVMYIGDARIEALCLYSITDDHRLPEKALRFFSLSQKEDGLILSRYPARVEQVIPSFMMIYLLMVHDYWRIHGNNSFMQEIFPHVRKAADYLVSHVHNGLIYLPGWNFIDWTKQWENGVPDENETNCILNWMAVYAFRKMAEMDDSGNWNEVIETMKSAIYRTYYIEKEKIFADDPGKTHFSEHAQVMAMLADPDAGVEKALYREDLAECGICYSFYYLEVCRMKGLDDLYEKRMAKYEALLHEGLTTLPEEFENPRSDCHAWSSHILYFSRLKK